MPPSIDIEDLKTMLRAFVNPEGEQFAITRDSLEIFGRAALGQLRNGVDAKTLAARTGAARKRALDSARAGNSTVPSRTPPMLLLRETDARAATDDCGSFEPI